MPCILGKQKEHHLGLLDTGAEWSVVPRGLASSEDLYDTGEVVRMNTRLGAYSASLSELTITLPATLGDSMSVEARVLVMDDWEGPLVLGFRGFLEVLRFAIDPGVARDAESLLFFGAA